MSCDMSCYDAQPWQIGRCEGTAGAPDIQHPYGFITAKKRNHNGTSEADDALGGLLRTGQI